MLEDKSIEVNMNLLNKNIKNYEIDVDILIKNISNIITKNIEYK
jgi:hypothetical protein